MAVEEKRIDIMPEPYHQDERDRYANQGCLVLLGAMVLLMIFILLIVRMQT